MVRTNIHTYTAKNALVALPHGGASNNRLSRQDPRSKIDVVLPYIQGMTERLKRVFRKHNIALDSKPGYTIRQPCVAPKDKLSSDEKQGVIYSVRCHGCDGEYVTHAYFAIIEVNNSYCNEKSPLSTHNLRTGQCIY